MIPHGRDVISTHELAAEAGQTISQWRHSTAAAELAARLRPITGPGERTTLYYTDQVRAVQAGEPVPRRRRHPAPHPDDLLTGPELAAELGISPATLRGYVRTGRIPAPTTGHHGNRWPRRVAHERQAAGDQRRTGTKGNKVTAHRSRVEDVARDLAAGRPVTYADIVRRYDVTDRTAARTVAAARQEAAEER